MSSPRPSDSHRNQKSSSFPVRFAKSALFQIFVFFTTVIVLGVAYASWTTLTTSQGADGQPVTQTLMQGIINNLNDLDSRVTALSSSVGGLGVGQTWQNVTSSRVYNVTYTNSTGKPIEVSVNSVAGGSNGIWAKVNGVQIALSRAQWNGAGAYANIMFIVPNGATYSVAADYGLSTWFELR